MPEYKPNIVTSLNVAKHRFEIYEGGAICFRVNGDLVWQDLGEIAGAFATEYTTNGPIALILDLSLLDHIDSKLLGETGKLAHFCVAVVVSGFGQRSLFSMATRLFGEQPKQPTRFFIDEAAAWEWVGDLRRSATGSIPSLSSIE